MKSTTLKLLILLLLSGCAGQPMKNADQGPDPLRGMVRERFDQPISDPLILAWLNRSDLQLNGRDRKLEYAILHELVNMEAKNQGRAVDRLWENNQAFKKLVSGEINRDGYEYPLAETYYLLSSVQTSSWEKDTAEKLYQQHLKEIQPNILAGYALHFYTKALLLNGKIEAAIPFLTRLSQFKPTDYFLDDLAYALSCSLSAKNTSHSLKIIEIILETGMATHPDKTDQILCAALPHLNQAGIFEQVEQALSPFVDQQTDANEYRFIPLMQKYLGDFITAKRRSNSVEVHIQVILTSKKDSFMDQNLVGTADPTNGDLHFKGYRVLKDRYFQLVKMESSKMPMPDGYWLTVTPVELSAYDGKLDIAIRKDGNLVFNTLVKTLDDGVAVIGGPQINDGMLLLRIQTDFHKEDQ